MNNKKQETNVLAIAGFTCSFLAPLVGLILSIIGLKQSSRLQHGKDLSIAGIIISSIGILLFIIVIPILFNFLETVLKIRIPF